MQEQAGQTHVRMDRQTLSPKQSFRLLGSLSYIVSIEISLKSFNKYFKSDVFIEFAKKTNSLFVLSLKHFQCTQPVTLKKRLTLCMQDLKIFLVKELFYACRATQSQMAYSCFDTLIHYLTVLAPSNSRVHDSSTIFSNLRVAH